MNHASIALLLIAMFAAKGQAQQNPIWWYPETQQYQAAPAQNTQGAVKVGQWPQNSYATPPQAHPPHYNDAPAPANFPSGQKTTPQQNTNGGGIRGVSSYQEITLKLSSSRCSGFTEGRVYCDGNGKLECEQNGCCYDNTRPGFLPCFYHPGMANDASSDPAFRQQSNIPMPSDSTPPASSSNPGFQETPPNIPPVSGNIVPPLYGNGSPPPAPNAPDNAPLQFPSSQDPARQLPPSAPSSGDSALPTLPPSISDLLQNGMLQFPDFSPTFQNSGEQSQSDNARPQLSFGPAAPANTESALPLRPISSNIAFSGCLLHCTSVARSARRVCVPDVGKDICNRVGCCFDEITNQCFHSNGIIDACPSRDECKLPLGPIELCGQPGVSKLLCEAQRCCYNKISGVPTCYRKQVSQQRQEPPPLPPQPKPTIAATDPTTKFNVLEKLKQLQDQLGGETSAAPPTQASAPKKRPVFVQEEISPRAADLASNVDPTKHTLLVPRVTTPPYVPPPLSQPQYRQQCDNRGRCSYVLVPPPTCFPKKCGEPAYTPISIRHSFDPRKIVGGSRAFPFSHPWTVMIQKIEGEKTYICGATLICRQWMVTAAHCLDRQSNKQTTADLDPYMYKIFIGRWAGWQSNPGRQVQVFKGNDIEVMVQHEKFIPGKHRGVITHDIALIKLRKQVRMDDFAQPACLPTQPPETGKVMFATGWGVSKRLGPTPTTLKQVGVEIKTKFVCQSRVPGFKDPVGVICGGGEPNHDTCTGDSGGPLVGALPGKKIRLGSAAKPRWHIFGLTSIGSPSCNTNPFDRQPALYTDIFYYLGWIKYMTNNCCA